jgi:peptidoglycan/LPS O-acetylase OafA/YrhL
MSRDNHTEEGAMANGDAILPTRRLVGLDVLRGVAIALVMLRHAWLDIFGEAGVVGVVILFTMSGYLITGVLIRDRDTTLGSLLRRFYRNRALRLLPAVLLFPGGLRCR